MKPLPTFQTVNMLQDHFWPNPLLPSRLSICFKIISDQTPLYLSDSICCKIISDETPLYLSDCQYWQTVGALRSSLIKPLSTFQTVCTFRLLPGNPTLLRTLEYSEHHPSVPCSVVSALSLIRLLLPGTNSQFLSSVLPLLALSNLPWKPIFTNLSFSSIAPRHVCMHVCGYARECACMCVGMPMSAHLSLCCLIIIIICMSRRTCKYLEPSWV